MSIQLDRAKMLMRMSDCEPSLHACRRIKSAPTSMQPSNSSLEETGNKQLPSEQQLKFRVIQVTCLVFQVFMHGQLYAATWTSYPKRRVVLQQPSSSQAFTLLITCNTVCKGLEAQLQLCSSGVTKKFIYISINQSIFFLFLCHLNTQPARKGL